MSSEGKVYNPIRYKGYYYDIETDMYYCKSRYYVPNLFRWISMDSINYLDIESISGNNLYMYCNNNPVMYSDGNGCYSSFIEWANIPNLFGASSTFCQLMINNASIYSYYRIANAVRPANIGLGIWDNAKQAALKSFKEVDVPKYNKASKILGFFTIGLQVVSAGVNDFSSGYSIDRIVSNTIVNTAIYSATTLELAKIGGIIGRLAPVPIVGVAIGTVSGYVIGFVIDLFLEMDIEGKSAIDHIRDWFYNTWHELIN